MNTNSSHTNQRQSAIERWDDEGGAPRSRTWEASPGDLNSLVETLHPSVELAAIVGSKPLARLEAVKKVWDYIKTHKLKDPLNQREIMADQKLLKVFGKSRVTIFELNRHLAHHLKPLVTVLGRH